MVSDPSKVKARGPWVWVQVDPPAEKSKGGLYIPQGNLEERMGQATATVLSCGKGHFVKKKREDGKDREVWEPMELQPGDKIYFRGFLKEANCPIPDRPDCCFLHVSDVMFVVEEPEVGVDFATGGGYSAVAEIDAKTGEVVSSEVVR